VNYSCRAVLLGQRQKQIYLGIRNKYCSVCVKAEVKSKEPTTHKCFKNWQGTFGVGYNSGGLQGKYIYAQIDLQQVITTV